MKLPLSTLAVTLLVGACGGGGGGDASTPPATSTVSSGAPLTITSMAVAIPASTYASNTAELGGWKILQQARVHCGFGALKQNTQLDAAAKAHARYLTSVSTTDSILSHYETVTSNAFYTGYKPWDRAQHQGYGTQVAEILASTVWNYDSRNLPTFLTMEQRGADAMLSLLNTVYHLSGAMYDGADIGFGADIRTYANGTARREEFRFGALNGYQTTNQRIRLGSGKVATYPCEGSTNIPPAFVPADESPNPFPTMTDRDQTVGPPIYLKVDNGQSLTLTSSSVSSGSAQIATQVFTKANDPHQEITSNEVFVVPLTALAPNTNYQVILSGAVNGTPFSRSFTMRTGNP